MYRKKITIIFAKKLADKTQFLRRSYYERGIRLSSHVKRCRFSPVIVLHAPVGQRVALHRDRIPNVPLNIYTPIYMYIYVYYKYTYNTLTGTMALRES